MTGEVAGVSLAALQEPIRYALVNHSYLTDYEVEFASEDAAKLQLTPEKPNSARSSTPVTFRGETAGTLHVIAFAPEDGTGDDKTFTTEDLRTGVYPPDPKYFPRSKAAIDSEAHLTLVSQLVGSRADPVLFAGHLRVLGLIDNALIADVGYVGQDAVLFEGAMKGKHPVVPRASMTTGYRGQIRNAGPKGERFWDPHAIINRNLNTVQVCGFLAISREMAPKHLHVLQLLHAADPKIT